MNSSQGGGTIEEDDLIKTLLEVGWNFLQFWAILFFTGLVGIVELLQEVKPPTGLNPLFILTGGLYLALVALMCCSIYSIIRIARENLYYMHNTCLGKKLRNRARKPITRTVSDVLLCVKEGEVKKDIEWIYIGIVVIFFTLLYVAKTIPI